MGGAVLSGRKTGRDFRAEARKTRLVFTRRVRHTASLFSKMDIGHVVHLDHLGYPDHVGDGWKGFTKKCHLSSAAFTIV